ncbi:thiol reductant ABC exporter subunit CydD [Actinomadura kijaniata]|uniref:thiol reductant ABC exporter subunit CydD n=1 Tax=Actinomadura kijaniata TaxID=46161 RepID=UPI00082AE874|nr:thiol reductant ABC exporter subunit CydD [Actinomadura kijaniata]
MRGVERRLLAAVPRRVLVVLGGLAAAQAVLVVVQAELLVRAVAGLVVWPLPWLAGAVAGRAVLGWVAARVAGDAAALVKRGLREALVARPLCEQDGGQPGGRSGGARVTLLTRGLDSLDAYLAGYVPQLVTVVVVPVVVWGRLVVADWPSALVVAVTVPLVPVFGALVGMRTAALTGRQWGLLERLGGHFRDVVAGLGTLRAYGRTEHQSQVVRRLAGEHRRATVAALRVAFLSSLVLELVCALSVALVAVPVGLRLLNGSMALATGLLVLVLTPEVYLPLRALGMRFHASAEGVAAARAAFGVLDSPTPSPVPLFVPPSVPATGQVRVADRAPEIVVEDVTVRYPGRERAALHRVSLRIAPGERVAVAGPSGAGKSTLLLVVAGLVAPSAGRVLVDGVELDTGDAQQVAAWRARLGWVPQHPHLFAASVADNIALGAPGADPRRVRRAARAAVAEEFIAALPEGYDTVLGEGGAGLSAGQRQRVAVARAWLTDAPVMLWDEPTARLDLGSERALVEAAGRLLAGRTALLVAHRPALLGVADRVVRLRQGRVHSGEGVAA